MKRKPGINGKKSGKTLHGQALQGWNPERLCDHISSQHYEFLRDSLPALEDHLKTSVKINPEIKAVSEKFLKFREVFENHMNRQEMILFPFIRSLKGKGRKKTRRVSSEVAHLIKNIRQERDRCTELLAGLLTETNHFTPSVNSPPVVKLAYTELVNLDAEIKNYLVYENELLLRKIEDPVKTKSGNTGKNTLLKQPAGSLKKILAATDFSRNSEYAVQFAEALANHSGTGLMLMNAYHVPAKLIPAGMSPPDLEMISKEQLIHQFNKIRKKVRIKSSILSRGGFAAEEIPSAAAQLKSDLVVMGTHGAGSLEKVVFGSTATATLRSIRSPLLLVPDGYSFKKPERILFACDFRETGKTVLNVLTNITRLFGSRLFILNILGPARLPEFEKAKNGVLIESFLNETDHVYYFEKGNDISKGLNDFIRKHSIDLLVMVPHRTSVLRRILNGSHTRKMALGTSVPLLVIPEENKNNKVFFL